MGLFDKIREPIFVKDSTKDERVIAELEELEKIAVGDAKNRIEQEIKRIKYGLDGEKKIEFELKNSHMPMLILRDLYLEHEGLSAQIDYLVLTRRRHFIIECKNLYGNLTICDNGDFVRTVMQNGVAKKERMYSPVTQNRRHLELVKMMRSDTKSNFFTKSIFEKHFYETYRSVVVLANYKGFLNTKYAPKEVAEQVINADQLIDYIYKVNNEKGALETSERQLNELAEYFTQRDCDNPTLYIEKFRRMAKESANAPKAVEQELTPTIHEEKEPVDTQPTKEESPTPLPSGNFTALMLLKERMNKQKMAPKEIVCQRCGAKMVKRTAKRGENKGNQFWGCSRFPQCRFIINMEDKEQVQ